MFAAGFTLSLRSFTVGGPPNLPLYLAIVVSVLTADWVGLRWVGSLGNFSAGLG